MEHGLPRKTPKRPEKVKVSDILSFTSAILAIVVSAIFYFAGWVYISHWYSFFGIDATELSISPQTVLIHGVPGVFVIIFLGLITVSIFAISKLVQKRETIALEDVPNIIMWTYSIAIIVLLVVAYFPYRTAAAISSIFQLNILSFLQWLPLEVKVSFIGVILLALFFSLTDEALALATGEGITILKVGKLRLGVLFTRNYVRLYLWLGLLLDYLKRHEFRKFFITLASMHDTSLRISNLERDFLDAVSKQQSLLRKAASETWQFWAGAFIILYFLVSISASSLFGEWDARAGKKSMVGGWQAEATYIYTNESNMPLPVYKAKDTTTASSVYGPMIILGKSGDTYYLIDWVDTFPIEEKPDVYIIRFATGDLLGMQILAPASTP